ncbi:MAG: zinc-dependent metalloprotease [Betaproteobacteria bacterium]|nr:zinc-dependent metalloprotease [Betaproteobacteria bacterium]
MYRIRSLQVTCVALLAAACAELPVQTPVKAETESSRAEKAKVDSKPAATASGKESAGATGTGGAGTSNATGQVPATTPSAGATPTGMPFSVPGASPEPRRYDLVITRDAKTSKGLVLHHTVKERHYFEIPESLLGKDLFWSVEVAQASESNAFNGLPLGHKVVRFERVGNRVLLRGVSFGRRGTAELKAATDAVGLAPILMAFNIETEGSERSLLAPAKPDEKATAEPKVADVKTDAKPEEAKTSNATKTETRAADTKSAEEKPAEDKPAIAKQPPPKEKWPVIEVTRLLTTTSPDLVDSRAMGPSGLLATDPTRSLVNQVKVFPRNVEIRSTLTFSAAPMPQAPLPGQPFTPSVQRNPSRSAVVHYSLAELPVEPMMGRYADARVGYFTERFQEYGGERSGMRPREFITRFRLDKKDPAQDISEPILPIVFHIAPEVPDKWRKYMKQGVEDWQPAFEKAGFKNAIMAVDAPSKKDHPDWDPEDARYSVIRWVAMPVANAMGPSVHDPRSGEVISAHIIFWHDILRLIEQWYYIQAGTADKRVTTLPLPDEILGEALRAITAHEVGHTLGLRHNNRASTAYTVKQLRDPGFTSREGTSASIMSYGRFNSIAQPGDGVTSFVPRLGPYDFFAIDWGYRPLGKTTPENEEPLLDKMAARQLENPQLAFGGEDWPSLWDPEVQSENIGRERVLATKLSLASLQRAAERLVPATTKLGEGYDDLRTTYFSLINQRANYLYSTIKLIGGVRETRYMGGRGGDSFVRVPLKEQQAALDLLLSEGLSTPRWLLDARMLNRIEPAFLSGPLLRTQELLLREMLSPLRFRLLEDAELVNPGQSLSAARYLAQVQRGLFSELKQTKPRVDVTRRELQRSYLNILKTYSSEAQRVTSLADLIASLLSSLSVDLRPAAINGLKEMQQQALAAAPNAADESTRLHLQQLAREAEQILKIRGS